MPLSWYLYLILIFIIIIFIILNSFSSKIFSKKSNLIFHKHFWKW